MSIWLEILTDHAIRHALPGSDFLVRNENKRRKSNERVIDRTLRHRLIIDKEPRGAHQPVDGFWPATLFFNTWLKSIVLKK